MIKELTKAQDLCYESGNDKLFDLCQYHIDFIYKHELTKEHKLIVLKFAKDVIKIAKLNINLEPLV